MSAAHGRGLRPGGVLRAVWRLVFLIAVGFGVGLLFGVVTEEPELLASHLRGESQSVALDTLRETEADLVGNPSDTGIVQAPVDDRAGAASAPTRIAASPPEADVDLPAVAASRPAPPAAKPSRPDPEPSGGLADRPASPDVETRAMRARTRWAIQVGAFSDPAAADRLAEGLRDRYPVDVLPASGSGGRWRVRIQPIRSEDQAREMADRLKLDDRLPTWVTPMEGRSGS